MAESMHTPGPWISVDGILDPDDEGHARSFIRPVHSEGYQIAQTVGPNGEANARLIAAAPEMRSELVRDRTFIVDVVLMMKALKLTDTIQFDVAQRRLEGINAALAKAGAA